MGDSIAKRIKDRIEEIEQGGIVTIRDFDDIQNNAVVRKTLSRLVSEGKLNRIANGIYTVPKETAFGVLNPSLDDIAHAIAKKESINIIPSGETALNVLGLSTQVPMKAIYLTEGYSRTYKVGKREIVFKKSTHKNFQFKSNLMNLLTIALKQLGEQSITKDNMLTIEGLISKSSLEEKTMMEEDLKLSPRWIKDLLLPMINDTK